MKKIISPILFLLFISSTLMNCRLIPKNNSFPSNNINKTIADKKALIGVSILDQDGTILYSLNDHKKFPLQSVFKFHIALAVLSKVDNGEFNMGQNIKVSEAELLPNLWSPLREAHPKGGTFPLSQLIEYAVSQSDNVACDVLLRLLGGPIEVEKYFIKNNVQDLSIKINEEKMQANWDSMFLNNTTPLSASQTLRLFYANNNNLLSKSSYDFIWNIMKKTETGQNRIKGLLPKGAIVAHKTGSSGTNKDGVTAAVNDIGIVFLPNGKYFFISVFVSNSTESEETNEKIIAEITKTTWEYFTKLNK